MIKIKSTPLLAKRKKSLSSVVLKQLHILAILVLGTPAFAQMEKICDVHIDEALLSNALNQLAKQCHMQVLYPVNLADYRAVYTIDGKYTVTQVLRILLNGTSLSSKVTESGFITVSSAIKINGEQDMFNKKNTLKNILAGILGGFAAGSSFTNAQDPSSVQSSAGGDASNSILEEIVVTARRREESLQEVPVAVTVFQPDAIEKLHIRNGADLMFNVPSLSVSVTAAGTLPNYGLRGQRDGLNATRSVVTYFAEVPVSGATTYQQSYDMQSIQVLKGPQGTLFGANSNGGAILFTPQKPTDQFEGEVGVALGEYDLREYTGIINIPIHDKIQVRAAGKYVRRDGYTENVNPCPGNPHSGGCGRSGDLDDEYYDSWRISVSAQPFEWLNNDFVYFATDDKRIGPSWIPYRFGNLFMNIFFANPVAGIIGEPTTDSVLADQQQMGIRKVHADEMTMRNETSGISNVTAAEFGGVTVKNIFGYQSTKNSFGRDQDGSIIPSVWQTQVPAGDIETYTDELQLLGSLFEGKVDYVVGGFLSRSEDPGNNTYAYLTYLEPQQYAILDTLGLGFLPKGAVTGNELTATNDADTDALFANLDIDMAWLLDGLSVSGGYRYTWTETTRNAPQHRVNGTCVAQPPRGSRLDAASCTLITENDSSGENYSVSLRYKFSDDLMFYLASRHGFKPGGINTHSALQQPELFTFNPEEITDYEVGLKSTLQLGEVILRSNLAAYTSDYSDVLRSEVIPQPSGVPATVTFNAEKATIEGIEAEFQLLLTENLNVGIFYSYIDAAFDKYQIPLPNGAFIDKSGEDFSAVSKETFGANISYRLPVDARYGLFNLSSNYYYRSSQTFADSTIGAPDDVFVPSYDLTNVRLDWEVPNSRLRLAASITNVTDEEYVIGGADYTTSVVGYAASSYGAPRMYRFEATYRF